MFFAGTVVMLSGSCAAQKTGNSPEPAAARSASTSPAKPESTAPREIILPNPPPANLRNPWPDDLEQAFQKRVTTNLDRWLEKIQPGRYGNTYFENEKKSYPLAIIDLLNGRPVQALKYLQSEDADAKTWNTVTDGIDFYPAFTLKGQTRKYFLLQSLMDPAYVERMSRAAKTWTEVDPLRRPHPYYKGGGDGWTPEFKNSWVDVRSTDNLRAMREVNTYLFAEDVGNEKTRLIYKDRIKSYVRGMYACGIGEWDSENYLGHTATSFYNLYDFAKDPEVRSWAKAALDWICTAAALDYYRGGWAVPVKRDYGGANREFGSLASRLFELYFGDTPSPNEDPEPDQVHLITSWYRPPATVMALARRDFPRPVEVLSTKPNYDTWMDGKKTSAQYWVTTFYGRTFQLGSAVSAGAVDDVGAFRLAIENSERGLDYFAANTQPVIGHQSKAAGDQIGQNRNLVVWLRPKDDRAFYFLAPKASAPQIEDGIWFMKYQKTFLALRPINLAAPSEVPILMEKKIKKEPSVMVPDEKFSQDVMLKAEAENGPYCGFALEVGEGISFDDFKSQVRAKGKLDLSLLPSGVVRLTGIDGHVLRLDHNKNDDLPLVHRDGKERRWQDEIHAYGPATSPVRQDWGGQELTVTAGGMKFTSQMTWEGKAGFSEVKDSSSAAR